MMQREKPGGHTERSIAIGTIEVAVWDAVAKIAGKPLYRVLAERYNGGGRRRRCLATSVAGGTQPGKGIPELLNEIRERLEQGYHAMKIKVGGATIPEDVKRVEAALKVVAGSRNLAVDANGAFDRSRALAYAEALAPFKLRWFEEPPIRSPTGYPLRSPRITKRRSAAAEISSPLRTWRIWCALAGCAPIATFSRSMCRNPMASCSSRARWRCSRSRGWRRSAIFPHGGNQMTLHIVGGFGLGGCEAYPGVFGVFAGFADDARMEDGYLELPDRPGIGFEAQNGLCE